jgi:hypothetical protein
VVVGKLTLEIDVNIGISAEFVTVRVFERVNVLNEISIGAPRALRVAVPGIEKLPFTSKSPPISRLVVETFPKTANVETLSTLKA